MVVDCFFFFFNFIEMDGCHLKDFYKWVLLIAVSIDTNCGIYYLARCIVENEKVRYISWKNYTSILGVIKESGCVLWVLDRKRGPWCTWPSVPTSIQEVLLHVYLCQFQEVVFWFIVEKDILKVCRNLNFIEFNDQIETLKTIIEAGQYWANHTFPLLTTCTYVANNMTKSFNN